LNQAARGVFAGVLLASLLLLLAACGQYHGGSGGLSFDGEPLRAIPQAAGSLPDGGLQSTAPVLTEPNALEAPAGQTSPQQVIDEWMGSTMHRYNLLHAEWNYVGVGIYYNGGDPRGFKAYWAAEFIQFLREPGSHDWIEPGDTPP